MVKMFEGPIFRQYLLVITVNLSMICIGLGQTWTSPMFQKLLDEKNLVLDRPITMNEAGWIASISFIGGFVALLFLTTILDNFGRKKTLLIFGIPRVFYYVLLTCASRVWMLYLGRLLVGLSDGVTAATVSIYSSEISSKENRGGLGTMLAIFGSIGALIMYSVGPYVNYVPINLICLAFALAAAAPVAFLPDSPYFLFSKGRLEEAESVLTYLRGSKATARAELKEYSSKNMDTTISLNEIITSKRYMKSLAIVICLNCGPQLGGISVVNSYLQTVLDSTQSSISSGMSSVIIGVIQLVACSCTTLVTDRWGRKPIILASQIGIAVGFVALGAFFSVTSSADRVEGWLNVLPLISLVLVVFCHNAGLGALMFPIISEVLDGRIRALGQSISQICSLILIVFSLMYFYQLVAAVGNDAAFYFFATWGLIVFVFVATCVPETKGKSFAEIQRGLSGEKMDES